MDRVSRQRAACAGQRLLRLGLRPLDLPFDHLQRMPPRAHRRRLRAAPVASLQSVDHQSGLVQILRRQSVHQGNGAQVQAVVLQLAEGQGAAARQLGVEHQPPDGLHHLVQRAVLPGEQLGDTEGEAVRPDHLVAPRVAQFDVQHH